MHHIQPGGYDGADPQGDNSMFIFPPTGIQ